MHVVWGNYSTFDIPLDLLSTELAKCPDCVIVRGYANDIMRRVCQMGSKVFQIPEGKGILPDGIHFTAEDFQIE
jgi:hypothetical protein